MPDWGCVVCPDGVEAGGGGGFAVPCVSGDNRIDWSAADPTRAVAPHPCDCHVDAGPSIRKGKNPFGRSLLKIRKRLMNDDMYP